MNHSYGIISEPQQLYIILTINNHMGGKYIIRDPSVIQHMMNMGISWVKLW